MYRFKIAELRCLPSFKSGFHIAIDKFYPPIRNRGFCWRNHPSGFGRLTLRDNLALGLFLQLTHYTIFLTLLLYHATMKVLKSSRNISIKKTPRWPSRCFLLCLLKARRLNYLSRLFCHLRISHSTISSATTLTNNGSKTSSRNTFSIKSHLPTCAV